MNIRHELTIELKQHSMLIHFQADRNGNETVCLRASEVKPKLDRFIVKLIGKKNISKNWIQAEHLNGVDVALKYRMTITHGGANPIPSELIPEIFYGNMGIANDKKRNAVWFNKGLQLKILCFVPDLMRQIEACIVDFFIVTNFGTMQSKGFGSFTVSEINGKSLDSLESDIGKVLKENYEAEKCFKIQVNRARKRNEAQNELFDTIKQIYSVMKSGSRSPFYHAYIYTYMHEKYKIDGKMVNIGNEKAYMKKKGVSPNFMTNSWVKRNWKMKDILGIRMDDSKYYYVRALLGVGKKITYNTDNPEYVQRKRGEKQYDKKTERPIPAKETITIRHVKNSAGDPFEDGSNERIERFSSPIFFKIIDNAIFIVAGRIDEEIKGKFFVFKNSSEKCLLYRHNQTNGEVVLQVPKTFDIDDFMQEFVNFYNDIYLKRNHTRNRNFKDYRIVEVQLCQSTM